jgi:hypothetical protein
MVIVGHKGPPWTKKANMYDEQLWPLTYSMQRIGTIEILHQLSLKIVLVLVLVLVSVFNIY